MNAQDRLTALEERLRASEAEVHDLAQQVGEWRQRAEKAEALSNDEVEAFLRDVAASTSKFAKPARDLLD